MALIRLAVASIRQFAVVPEPPLKLTSPGSQAMSPAATTTGSPDGCVEIVVGVLVTVGVTVGGRSVAVDVRTAVAVGVTVGGKGVEVGVAAAGVPVSVGVGKDETHVTIRPGGVDVLLDA